ncbi:hypothetical protein JL108_16140 [Aeromicrobium sp. YIM 150415]|uniref:hypothetical protein n=1 Tax=Aeromicrobium sp. YIM 150415 TaxID=2803912 RepID=UPI001966AE8A|nr:hypothetical protein [Aeromicrobium sp. YIM 150415]MBM9464983.1 hypothetical protein [Aeromicrobium sp. YIM 150415]
MKPLARVVAAGLLIAATLVWIDGATSPPAVAIDHSRGHPGFCEGDRGVTVVVDFQELGGQTIVRCHPQGTAGSGLDALRGAGIQVAGTQRWGEGFVCRLENRPRADESLGVEGQPGYREACVNTPPSAAYWSYWHAGNNCAWSYSNWGVKNRDFVQGGFEGWSFSLNGGADDAPRPRVAAVRPGTEGGSCTVSADPAPSSTNPMERQRGSTGAAQPGADDVDTDSPRFRRSAGQEGSTPASGGSLPAPMPRDAPDDPADNVSFTGGEDADDVRQAAAEDAGASRYAPWAAASALLLLVGSMWWIERRRRRARQGE